MAKRYKVTGTQAFEGHAPGETFDGGLTEGQEQFGLSINAIKVVSTDVASDKRIQSGQDKATRSSGSGSKKG